MLFSVRKSGRQRRPHKLDKKTFVPRWHDKPRRPGAVLLWQSSPTFTAAGTICVFFCRCGWITVSRAPHLLNRCVIAPNLFTVYLCTILFLDRDRLPHGVELDYRLDGRLFNLSRLTAVIDLQYADDCAILAHSAEELQSSLDPLTEAYQSLGLSINIRKTKVIHQPTPGINEGPPEIKVSGGILEVVEHFQYLGSHLSQKATIKAENQHCICCASTSFRKPRHRVFDDHNLRKETMVYKAISITTTIRE